ncbi:mitochondrial inner membrane protease subunit 1 [Aplysia californica]|uniref:Mitochondrial inner membrane protease subunit 1 n=1 Tax=Aplysia californica TaxID=6500 RepID=A0ABM1ABI0_APLCA|nr:mitochondrial inner membrane protease subunit 1 [Aplysia californica]
MFKAARKGFLYTVSGLSACYCTLRFIGGIGRCEDVSMEPAIQHGDVVLISPIHVDYKKLQKGDVVFCRAPKNSSSVICKRLMGMEGDTVFNNEKGFEEYVGRGQVWLEGDNQEASIDSRSYGQLPYGLLLSKVCFRIWPLHRVGPISFPERRTTAKEKAQTKTEAKVSS